MTKKNVKMQQYVTVKMMNNESIHKQVWGERLTRITRSGTEGSIVLEIYHKPQGKFGIEAYISNLMVEEANRRKGVANDLMAWAEGKAKEEGYTKVYLEWHRAESQYWTRDWYERRGYKELAFGNSGCLMMKEL